MHIKKLRRGTMAMCLGAVAACQQVKPDSTDPDERALAVMKPDVHPCMGDDTLAKLKDIIRDRTKTFSPKQMIINTILNDGTDPNTNRSLCRATVFIQGDGFAAGRHSIKYTVQPILDGGMLVTITDTSAFLKKAFELSAFGDVLMAAAPDKTDIEYKSIEDQTRENRERMERADRLREEAVDRHFGRNSQADVSANEEEFER